MHQLPSESVLERFDLTLASWWTIAWALFDATAARILEPEQLA